MANIKETEDKWKEMLNEAMSKQEESIKNFITGSSKLIHDKLATLTESLTNIGVRLDNLEQKTKENENTINDIEISIKFTQSLIDRKMNDFAKDSKTTLTNYVNNFQGALYAAKQQENHLRNKLRVLEDRNRRNNLKIDGIPESIKETWAKCEEKVKHFLKGTMEINKEIKIERTH